MTPRRSLPLPHKKWKPKFLLQQSLHFYQQREFTPCQESAQQAIDLAPAGSFTSWRAKFYHALALPMGSCERLEALEKLHNPLQADVSSMNDRDFELRYSYFLHPRDLQASSSILYPTLIPKEKYL